VWRVNVVETTAMSNADFLIGSFGLGAQLHDRENVSVRVSTETGNNFTDGVCTFLAAERVALEIPRPESFICGSWTTPV
jgi:HK97 family phage major capsid protein